MNSLDQFGSLWPSWLLWSNLGLSKADFPAQLHLPNQPLLHSATLHLGHDIFWAVGKHLSEQALYALGSCAGVGDGLLANVQCRKYGRLAAAGKYTKLYTLALCIPAPCGLLRKYMNVT